jgi:hypothetical protein
MPFLNEKQQQLVRDLARLSNAAQHRSFTFTPTFNNKDNIEAHGTGVRASGNEKDLRALETEGMVTLKWVRHGAANGTVLQALFDAAKAGLAGDAASGARVAPAGQGGRQAPPQPFAAPPVGLPSRPVPAAAPAPPVVPAPPPSYAPAPAVAVTVSGNSNADVAAQVAALMADLLGTLRAVLPADEAEAAEGDAAAIGQQLYARQPDVDLVARRVRSLVARLTTAIGSAADLTGKGPRLGEAFQKLSPFVAHIGHWSSTRRAA